MKLHRVLAGAVAISVAAIALGAESEAPSRPRIVGISHAAFFVGDLAKARDFYEGFLGFQSPYTYSETATGGSAVWIKINDRQSIELLAGAEIAPDADRLAHVALEVEDVDAMRRYLEAKGITVPSESSKSETGDRRFTVSDPNGNRVEFIQHLAEGATQRAAGQFVDDRRISERMTHVGVMVGELDASVRFYGEILGFRETWRGSAGGQTLNWINMRVPDGSDYVEFMLYEKYPTADRLRTMHHVCLEVPDIEKAAATLATRRYPEGSKPASALKAGVNGKRQINFYDVDGTRVEIMEPNTHDGLPRPSSTARAPVAESRVPVSPRK